MEKQDCAHLIKEIPFERNKPPYEVGTLLEKPFFGFDKLSFRYGFCGQPGLLAEETDKKHVHDYDQLLFFLSSDPDDMLHLGGEVEIALGENNERFRFGVPTAVAIPKGMPHFPAVIRSLDRKIVYINVSAAPKCEATVVDPDLKPDEGPLSRFDSKYLNNVIWLSYHYKHGYLYGSDAFEDSGGLFTAIGSSQCHLDLVMSWESIRNPHRMGPRDLNGVYTSHEHDFDEAIFFLGTDPDDPSYLGGEVEWCMGEDKVPYTITKSTAVVVPKGVHHTPHRFVRVDKPFIFVALCCSGTHISLQHDENSTKTHL